MIKHMKNKLFFSKCLATPRLFVYERKVIASVLGDGFRVLDQGPIWRNFIMAKKPKKTKGT
jgi:hypothetical protein